MLFLTSYINIDQDFSLLNEKTQPFSGAKIVGYIFLLHTWIRSRILREGMSGGVYALMGMTFGVSRQKPGVGVLILDEWVFLEKSTASSPLNPWMGKEGRWWISFWIFKGDAMSILGRVVFEGFRISSNFVEGVPSENFQSLGLELRFLFWMYPAGNQHILF